MQPGLLRLDRLGLRGVRNLKAGQRSFSPHLNLISGPNGHGKTSLIEAIYLVCTTQSFRTSRLSEVITTGETLAEAQAHFVAFGLPRKQSFSIGPRARRFFIEERKMESRLTYALTTPVVAFHPGDLELVSGPSVERRALLDRVLLHLDREGAVARSTYQRALKERQRLLVDKGPEARELGAFEEVLARSGARFQKARWDVVRKLQGILNSTFRSMAPGDLELVARFEPGGSEDVEEFLRKLASSRDRDQHRGSAGFGPHRDELQLEISLRKARQFGSQGQQRLLALALKLTELALIRDTTQCEPILLLDDVSSELDRERTDAVFRFLGTSESQIFVTTTRPELFSEVGPGLRERRHYELSHGQMELVSES